MTQPTATAAQSFVWREGQATMLIKKGDPLTASQQAHAEQHGFIKRHSPAKKNTPAPEVPAHEQP